MVNQLDLRIEFCLEGSVFGQDGVCVGNPLGIQLGSQSVVGNCQDFSSQQSGVDTAVNSHGCHRNAGGHHHSGQQGIHAVIGLPCKGPCFDGMDALLSTVMMPSGIPVATVAVNGGVNAALLAAQIIAVSDDALAAKLDAKRESDAKKVLEKDAALQAELNA